MSNVDKILIIICLILLAICYMVVEYKSNQLERYIDQSRLYTER